MKPRFFAMLALLVLGSLTTALAESHLIVFKDGFVLTGRTKQSQQWLVDRVSGKSFKIPVGECWFEDEARIIQVTTVQLQDAVKVEDDSNRLVRFRLPAPLSSAPLAVKWALDDVGPWGANWERTIQITELLVIGPRAQNLTQRLTELNPRFVRVDTRTFSWMQRYLTSELGPEVVRKLIGDHYDRQRKKLSVAERRLETARFCLQAGWLELAERELEGVEGNSDVVDPLRAEIRGKQQREFIAGLEESFKLGRYEELAQRLKRYTDTGMATQVSEQQQIAVQELKNKWTAGQEKLQTAQRHLKELPDLTNPQYRTFFKEAAAALLREVTLDNLERLDTFLGQARSYDLARQQKRPSGQTPDQLLSFAVSGWLLGSGAAEENVGNALQLWRARKLILDYQKSNDQVARRRLLTGVESKDMPPVDVLARLIRNLPPPDPSDKLETDVQEIQGQLPDGGNTSYLVKLPPEYQHGRSYPVLIVLHQDGERPATMLQRWSELAAKAGFILAAPSWGKGEYTFSTSQHAAVLDCLRHLRRAFQVDSDRVFLFGAGEGGKAAYDIGFAHPDQFAGLLPMSALPTYYPARYLSNPQYLPLYIVDGQRDQENGKEYAKLFAQWNRWRHPVTLVQYKGRGAELFTGEFPRMMEWMKHKKRFHPRRDLEDYQTMRVDDNRFYFLSTSAISPSCLNAVGQWNRYTRPATMKANIFSGNQIHVRTSGLKQVSIWLSPGMIDFSQKVSLQVNGANGGPPRLIQPNPEVLLEDFTINGDRERLYLARLDINL